MPAYSGTAVRLDTPGTTSKSMPPRTQAAASSATALSRNGSPVTSRTTRAPVGGVLEHDLGPGGRGQRAAGLGQAERGDLGTLGQGDRRVGQDLPLPVVVQDHRRLRRRARRWRPRVSRSGSPGPVPTKITRPRVTGAGGGWGTWSGASAPTMCSLTSRVLLFSLVRVRCERGRSRASRAAASSAPAPAWLAPNPPDPPRSRGPRRTARDRGSGLVGSDKLLSKFSQLPRPESNRALVPRTDLTRARAPTVPCSRPPARPGNPARLGIPPVRRVVQDAAPQPAARC